jgi:hypothetical protein
VVEAAGLSVIDVCGGVVSGGVVSGGVVSGGVVSGGVVSGGVGGSVGSVGLWGRLEHRRDRQTF